MMQAMTQQPEALRLADALTIPECTLEHGDCMKAGELLRTLHARVQQLEASESRLITQRDHCEEVIDRIADAVLGTDRHEWTSAYGFDDAAEEIEGRIPVLEAQQLHPLSDERIQQIDDETPFHESPGWALRFARNLLAAAGKPKDRSHEQTSP